MQLHNLRTGIGYDTHAFGSDKPLILGGITIPAPQGLLAHSDGDVLVHALIDALLGAASMPDIGALFPDTDQQYKNISSMLLLQKVKNQISDQWEIINADMIIICERPKMRHHIPSMKKNIIEVLGTDAVNVKATTTEGMNAEGEGRCISAQAAVLILRRDSSVR